MGMQQHPPRPGYAARQKKVVLRPARFPTLATHRAPDDNAARSVTNEGSPAVRYRTAVVVPPSRYEVILVSRCVRARLRGRNRMSVTST